MLPKISNLRTNTLKMQFVAISYTDDQEGTQQYHTGTIQPGIRTSHFTRLTAVKKLIFYFFDQQQSLSLSV